MRSVIEPAEILSFVTTLLHPVMHFKRANSIGLAVTGAMHADRLSVAAVGRALARQSGITPKSGIKQVDRLLSNPQFDVEATFHQTVPWIVGRRKDRGPPKADRGRDGLDRVPGGRAFSGRDQPGDQARTFPRSSR